MHFRGAIVGVASMLAAVALVASADIQQLPPTQMPQTMSGLLSPVVNLVSGAADSLVKGGAQIESQVRQTIGGTLNRLSSIGGSSSRAAQQVGSVGQMLVANVNASVSGIMEQAQNAAKQVTGFVTDNSLAQSLQNSLMDIVQRAQAIVQQLVSSVSNPEAAQKLQGELQKITSQAQDVLKQVPDAATSQAGQAFVASLQGIMGQAQNATGMMAHSGAQQMGQVANELVGQANKTTESVQNGVQNLVELGQNIGGQAVEGVKNGTQQVTQQAQDLAGQMVSLAQNGTNQAVEQAENSINQESDGVEQATQVPTNQTQGLANGNN